MIDFSKIKAISLDLDDTLWPVWPNADICKVGLEAYFDAAFNPINLGVGKPDPKMFHAGAQALGVLPEEVLHIGDDPHLDVLAAQRAGLQAVWVNREEKLWTHEVHPAPFTVINLKELCQAWPLSTQ